MHLANVEMADLPSRTHLRRQPVAIAPLGGLDGHSSVQLLVQRFVDHTHAAPAGLIENAEPVRHQFSRLERPVEEPQRAD